MGWLAGMQAHSFRQYLVIKLVHRRLVALTMMLLIQYSQVDLPGLAIGCQAREERRTLSLLPLTLLI